MSGRNRQTRAVSLVEAVTNVAVGYALALLAQRILFPLFSIRTTLAEDSAIAAAFTLLSLARSYLLRRLFERIATPVSRPSCGSPDHARPQTKTSQPRPHLRVRQMITPAQARPLAAHLPVPSQPNRQGGMETAGARDASAWHHQPARPTLPSSQA